MKVSTIRWHVRQVQIRQPRFGETRRDVLRWTVIPYIGYPGSDYRRFAHDPDDGPHFRTLGEAVAYARAQCATRYGKVAS